MTKLTYNEQAAAGGGRAAAGKDSARYLKNECYFWNPSLKSNGSFGYLFR